MTGRLGPWQMLARQFALAVPNKSSLANAVSLPSRRKRSPTAGEERFGPGGAKSKGAHGSTPYARSRGFSVSMRTSQHDIPTTQAGYAGLRSFFRLNTRRQLVASALGEWTRLEQAQFSVCQLLETVTNLALPNAWSLRLKLPVLKTAIRLSRSGDKPRQYPVRRIGAESPLSGL